MPGPPPKPADRRQRWGNPEGVTIARGDRIVRVPEPPPGLDDTTVAEWESFWRSDVAQVVEADSDMPALRRLFRLYDERERSYRAYREQRIVKGSMGQPVVNKIAQTIKGMDAEIRQLEDRFGMNPKARLQLGIQMTEARKGLNALMDGLDPYAETDGDGDEEADLRAV